MLICGASEPFIWILDAYKGTELLKITNFVNDNSLIECSFTPDSKYIISGSETGNIYFWNLKGELVETK